MAREAKFRTVEQWIQGNGTCAHRRCEYVDDHTQVARCKKSKKNCNVGLCPRFIKNIKEK